MKKKLTILTLVVFLLSAIGFVGCKPQDPTPPQAKHYSYEEVVSLLTDVKSLAILPEVGESTAAATSYDRDSKYDEATDKYIEWGNEFIDGETRSFSNNDDANGCIETYSDGSILAADIKGAGTLVRTFSATPSSGNIKIYIDGATTPTIDMPFKDYVSAKGMFAGLDNMVYETDARGFNNYVPVTFNDSCKIIFEEGWGKYYSFQFRLFENGATVEPITEDYTTKNKTALEKANDVMGGALNATYDNEVTALDETITLTKNATTTIFEESKQNAITSFKIKFNDDIATDPLKEVYFYEVLQKLEISMFWDGETKESVWAPLGDFFANPGGQEYTTVPMGKTADGWFWSAFYMPYRTGAKIVIKNLMDTDYSVDVEIKTAPITDNIDDLGRFHAKWTMQDRLQSEIPERFIDYVALQTEGRGRFVGFNLNVFKKGDTFRWWGEGDEKFFVDGEKFPSTYGTGSEDYFGYAWCEPTLFDNAFHAQNWNGGDFLGARGNYNNVRFHILDNVPFQTSFEAAIEKTWTQDSVSRYGSTVFWYLDEKGVDPYTPYMPKAGEEFRYGFVQEKINDFEALGDTVIEGEDLKVLYSKNLMMYYKYDSRYFSNNQYGLMKVRSTGDNKPNVVEFRLLVKKDYQGPLNFVFGTGKDFGKLDAYIDGAKILSNVDLYEDAALGRKVVQTTNDVTLQAGEYVLKFDIHSKNSASTNYHSIFDCVVLGDSSKVPNLPEIVETNGILSFDYVEEGEVSGTITYEGDTYFKDINKMGSGVTYEIVEENGEKFYRTTSTSNKAAGGHYIGLKNVTAGTYKVTITLRFSDGATLINGKNIKTRLASDTSTDVILDELYANATADANGWRTVSYLITTTKEYTTLRIYNQFKTGGEVDVKGIKIETVK